MKATSNYTITKVQRGIFTVLLLSQLLTSCGGEAREIGTEAPQAPLQSSAASAEAEVLTADAARPVGHIQEVSYRNMAGDEVSMQIDPAHTTIAEFLAVVKQQANLRDSVCCLVSGLAAYREDDTRLLHPILVHAEELNIVKISNAARAQELLGDNYIGEDAWKKLGIEDSSLPLLPPLSDEMLAEAKRLQELAQEPLLVLDLGKSIAEMERLCTAKDITVLEADGDDAKLRAETFYQAVGTGSRWLLLPGSDHGVLPGSRDKNCDDQVKYMESNYPGYAVGGVRELVTLAMLKHIQDGTVLFPNQPYTYGKCKEEYQTGHFKGHRVVLGSNRKNDSGSVFGLVVSYSNDYGLVNDSSGLFVLACPDKASIFSGI